MRCGISGYSNRNNRDPEPRVGVENDNLSQFQHSGEEPALPCVGYNSVLKGMSSMTLFTYADTKPRPTYCPCGSLTSVQPPNAGAF